MSSLGCKHPGGGEEGRGEEGRGRRGDKGGDWRGGGRRREEGRRERRQERVEGRRGQRGEKKGGDCGWYFPHTLSTSYMDQEKHYHLPKPDLEKGLAMPLGLR